MGNSETSETYAVQPVLEVTKIIELLGDNPEAVIEDILISMGDIVPTDFSLRMVSNILDLLREGSSSLNKVWTRNGEVVGFLIIEERDGRNGTDAYIKYFGFQKSQTGALQRGLILGNIRKLITKAEKKGFDTVSLNGFNHRLNRILMRRFGFQVDESKSWESFDPPIPYLFLELTQDAMSVAQPRVTHSLSELEVALFSRQAVISDEDLEVIREKVANYLKKTGVTVEEISWSTMADAIVARYDAITTGSLGINTVLKLHMEDAVVAASAYRAELAELNLPQPELLLSGERISLYRLVNELQLKNESAQMGHCVGDSDYYLKRITRGTSQVWSVRNEYGEILLTIEYDVRKQAVVQMKKKSDRLLKGNEVWFRELFRFFNQLETLKPPIPIKEIKDIGNIECRNGLALTRNEFKEVALLNEDDRVVKGSMQLTDAMTDEEIAHYCSIPDIDVDTTHLNFEQKKKLFRVEGTLLDTSSRYRYYPALKHVGGLHIPRSGHLEFGMLETISGDARFPAGTIFGLNKLQEIGGSTEFIGSKVELNSLKKIGGTAQFRASKVENLSKLETIGGDAIFTSINIYSMENLRSIGGFALFHGAKITDLSKLEFIGSHAIFSKCNGLDLQSLRHIGSWADFTDSEIKDLGRLESIAGNAIFTGCTVPNLGELLSIQGKVNFINAKVDTIDSLKEVSDVDFSWATIGSMQSLAVIHGYADFSHSKIGNIDGLREIRGHGNFSNAEIKRLPNLQKILGNANFTHAEVESLDSLEYIQREARFSYSKITDIPAMKEIGGDAHFNNSRITDWSHATIGGEVYE